MICIQITHSEKHWQNSNETYFRGIFNELTHWQREQKQKMGLCQRIPHRMGGNITYNISDKHPIKNMRL